MTFDALKETLNESSHWIELVSYGLAPNPNGFCYEVDRDCPEYDAFMERALSEKLETLSKSEEQELRDEYL